MRTLIAGLLIFSAQAALAQADDYDMNDEAWVTAEASVADENVVEFHIKAGTGEGPWNTLANPIKVKVGQTLRFINDDNVYHWQHTTNSSPCPHGEADFGPGKTYDCVISKKHNASLADSYDHAYGNKAQVYIQAD
jgi:hypothetical protein